MVFSSAIVGFDRDHVCSTRDSDLSNWCDCRIEFWSFSGTLINVLGNSMGNLVCNLFDASYKILDKNGDQSLGPVHSTDEASKNWDYGGLHDSNYSFFCD